MAADKERRSWGIRVEAGTALRGDTLERNGQPVSRISRGTGPHNTCFPVYSPDLYLQLPVTG